MKDIELKNKAITWIAEKSMEYKTRPQKFTPSEVADAVGARFNRIGHAAQAIVAELESRNIKIKYVSFGNNRYFELY